MKAIQTLPVLKLEILMDTGDKIQNPKSKIQTLGNFKSYLAFGIWALFGIWDLGFGISEYQVWADSTILKGSTTHFIGNVKFTQHNLIIETFRAVITENKATLYDTIIVQEDSLLILGKDGEYWFNEEKGNFRNGIMAQQGTDIIVAESSEYLKGKDVTFNGNVEYKKKEQDLVVRGDKGLYNPKKKYMVIMNNAYLKQGDITAYSDTINYFTDKENATLSGNVCVVTKIDTLYGKIVDIYIRNGETEKVIVRGKIKGKRKK